MTRFISTLLGLLYVALSVLARDTPSVGALKEKRYEAAKRRQLSPRVPRRKKILDPYPGVQNITFSNPNASQFYVDGTIIPEIDFDVGPSWSGLIPISGTTDETRMLFFWFFPPGPEGSPNDLILWMNGGPGCSSLKGLLQENGPFSWGFGQARPTQNEWSWTNVSSMLYIEQPVGTGFSQGEPNAVDENDVAAQFVGFLQQFLEIFSELKGKRFFIAGESYAGMYIPYIANYIYENTTRSTFDLDLQGIWINDPVLGWRVVHMQIPAVGFVHKYENVFAFNKTFLAQLDSIAEKCNYSDYMSKYVTYPPQGLLPLPGNSTEFDGDDCEVWGLIFEAALLVNPAFNQYRIFDTWPILWDVLGFPGSSFQAQTTPLYFDRPQVKRTIHALTIYTWAECFVNTVFPNGDASLPPAFTVLQNVIEKNNRTVIVHGRADYNLIAEGTRIVLQNLTWAGKQGFQNPIVNDSFVIDNGVALGTVQSERGLTYIEVALAGHMVPQFSPVASLQIMDYLVGSRINP